MAAIFDAFILIVRKMFDIREGEMHRSVLMQANIFLIISTLLIVKPTVNGLFLSKFGIEQLPNAFILVAIAAAVVSTLYSRLLIRIPLKKIMTGTILWSVITLVFFGLFLRFDIFEGVVLYLFYIWVAIFALLATSQFWVLANLVFNAREAKRLFGFIGAGAIGGGIFGGYLTSVIANVMNSENLLFVAALLLIICIPITRTVWEKHIAGTQTSFQLKKRMNGVSDHPATLILQSRHLIYLAGIVGVSVMVAKLVDYQFGGVASSLITDPDELTSFFGFWFSTFNLISLLLQLFLTRRIVGTFGVGTSLFFLPGLILIAATLLLIMPELLLAAVFLKMSDGSLKQSINKAAMELIILPIPTDIKNQTKTFIDVFVDSLATGISGLVLIFLIRGLNLPTYAVSLMIIGLILLWIWLAYRVRGEYLNSFKLKLDRARGDGPPEKKPIDLSSESAIGGLTQVLNSGTDRQIMFVLQKIRELHNDRFFEPVRKLLYHPSADIRAEALTTLYMYKKPSAHEDVEPLIHDESQKVKIQAFEYLIQHSSSNRFTIMNEYLRDKDYRVRGAALVTLARDNRDNPRMKNAFGLEKRIRELLAELPLVTGPKERFEKVTLVKAIGYANIPVLHEHLFHFFKDDDEEVVKNTILGAGHTLSPIFIGKLLYFLADDKYQESARQALINYGKAIIPELQQQIDMPGIDLEAVRVLPSVVKEIGSQQSVDFLFGLFDHPDSVVRQEALRGLNILRNSHPHLKFDKRDIVNRIHREASLYHDTLSVLYSQINLKAGGLIQPISKREQERMEARRGLTRLLEQRLDRNLERIFRLLGLNYPSEDIIAIYESLKSDMDDLRVNALEFLDNLLEPNLKKIIIPIIETAMLETISEEAIRNLNLKIPDEYECYRLLLLGRDTRIKLAVLYLIGQLNDEHYLPLVEEAIEKGPEKVRRFANGIIKQLHT